jgi:hypothetical protein
VDTGDAVNDALRQPDGWTVGTVSGTSGQKVIVAVSGMSPNPTIPRAASYSPVVNGDVVLIAWTDKGPIVICKIAT